MVQGGTLMLQKLFANLAVVALLVLCSIGVNVYGWGLTPRSWWWIIGVGLFVTVFIRVVWDEMEKGTKK